MIAERSKTERDRDVDRKRKQRAEAKTVIVPDCADKIRRAGLEDDDIAWLRWYCAELFWYDFTPQQRAMIEAIRNAILYGGDQALAASRGEGKTKLFERMLMKYTLSGAVKFAVLFAATGAAAENSLQSMRDEIERNERLHDDYPEVCVPVRALEDTPNRAHYQLVTGRRHDNGEVYEAQSSRFTWCGHEIIYPNVPGAPAAWGIIATRGLDAAVRGLNKKNRRPEVVGIDDPDTEDTVRSEEQARKLEERIDRGIAGLGGQQRGVARVMLSTLQRRECVSAWFTDPQKKPSFKGKRFRFLVKKPDREDLWTEYIEKRQANQREKDEDGEHTDEFARGAHNFYLGNRDAMDAGAEVANPHRFNPQELPDGSQLEVSALQRYYNEVARIGQDAVSTEYDNDPPEESGITESGITPELVRRQVSGQECGVIPEGCTVLVHGVDVGKWWLHWVVRAFRPDGTGFTIDYGRQNVYDTKHGSEEGLDRAIKREVLRRVAEFREQPYAQKFRESLTLVDSGYRTEAVYAACAEAGLGVMPIKGIGHSAGVAEKGRFVDVMKRTKDRQPICDGVFYSTMRLAGLPPFKLVCASADQWKAWEHDRWQTATDKPGCLFLWGEKPSDPAQMTPDQREHGHYAHHICAEVEVEDVVKGGIVRKWKSKNKENHWLDASYYADVAAAIKGVRVFTGAAAAKPVASRPTAAQLAAITRGNR